jgi:hypothetical protein
MNCKKKLLSFLIMSVIAANAAFGQAFTRTIELQSRRMNGPDVKNLQTRLHALGFNEIGEADGIYGPFTEGAVKKIQKFVRIGDSGKVNRKLWDFLFDAENEYLLRYIQQVTRYALSDSDDYVNIATKEKCRKKEVFSSHGDESFDSASVYYSRDNQPKYLFWREMWSAGAQSWYRYCYFVTQTTYLIEYHTAGYDDEMNREFKESVFLVENSKVFELVEGKKRPTDFKIDWIQSILQGKHP